MIKALTTTTTTVMLKRMGMTMIHSGGRRVREDSDGDDRQARGRPSALHDGPARAKILMRPSVSAHPRRSPTQRIQARAAAARGVGGSLQVHLAHTATRPSSARAEASRSSAFIRFLQQPHLQSRQVSQHRIRRPHCSFAAARCASRGSAVSPLGALLGARPWLDNYSRSLARLHHWEQRSRPRMQLQTPDAPFRTQRQSPQHG